MGSKRITDLTDDEICTFIRSAVLETESITGIERIICDTPEEDEISCTVVSTWHVEPSDYYPDGLMHREGRLSLYGDGTLGTNTTGPASDPLLDPLYPLDALGAAQHAWNVFLMQHSMLPADATISVPADALKQMYDALCAAEAMRLAVPATLGGGSMGDALSKSWHRFSHESDAFWHKNPIRDMFIETFADAPESSDR